MCLEVKIAKLLLEFKATPNGGNFLSSRFIKLVDEPPEFRASVLDKEAGEIIPWMAAVVENEYGGGQK